VFLFHVSLNDSCPLYVHNGEVFKRGKKMAHKSNRYKRKVMNEMIVPIEGGFIMLS
jgi:hypothetical protein